VTLQGLSRLKKHIVMFEPSGLRIFVDEQSTFFDSIRMVGLHLPSDCGGRGTCGKCVLILHPAPEPTPQDKRYLSLDELEKGFRLACQHKVKTETRVMMPEQQREVKILTEGISQQDKWIPDSGNEGCFGVAIDLGTTTIVAYLLALDSGIQVNQLATLNPQVVFGEDVMSRITHAIRMKDGLHELTNKVLTEIDMIIDSLVKSSGIANEELTRLSVVGNTAMHHLLLGADVKPLGVAPYEPTIRNAIVTSGKKLGLSSNPDIEVFLPPNIAGFVGGDTVGFILSQRLDLSDQLILGIDVGTNGEIVLSNRGSLSCCSTAAGPAFEGATIRYGMRGQEGAIEHVVIQDPKKPPEVTVIGDTTPQGICGSAIVDIVAEMRRTGIIEKSGRMNSDLPGVYNDDDFGLSYILVEETSTTRRISFNQKDVRQVQLAKAAINSGVSILLKEAEVIVDDIDAVMLAGAFGSYVRPESALGIGLLPPVKRERIIQVGNAAGEGAKALLLSSQARAIANEFVSKIRYIELAAHNDFQSIFIDSIPLP
jgi:uncharacterized 2Fe-2S/4Fe-4S cluster protein (DUF4445 family)